MHNKLINTESKIMYHIYEENFSNINDKNEIVKNVILA